VGRLASDARSNPASAGQLETFRKQADLAASLLRDGKDPLVEAPELRSGPLLPILESLKSTPTEPIVSRMSLGEEEELVGAGQDALPPDWPKPSHAEGTSSSVDVPSLERGLQDLIREVESLRSNLAGDLGAGRPSPDDPQIRTPAQLVDAVVLTAADGIEDLAAGLMRANELASVAERVTNRATLLALNAALEATRSGSEAFAAIAEETRRLAEFAREATDTISRLSSEIEYKVGETITAIHATSEDAKNSLAELSGAAPASAPVSSATRQARVQVVRLLDRSRELLRSLGPVPAPVPAARVSAPAPPPVAAPAAIPSDPRDPARPEFAPLDETPEPPHSEQDPVENASEPADKSTAEGMLLIEGLKPGARLES
jgi:hypothetical protein